MHHNEVTIRPAGFVHGDIILKWQSTETQDQSERLLWGYKCEQTPIRHKHQINSNINKPFIRACSGLDFSHTLIAVCAIEDIHRVFSFHSTSPRATSHILSGGKVCPMSCPVSNLHSYTSSKSPHPKDWALGLILPADIQLKYALPHSLSITKFL